MLVTPSGSSRRVVSARSNVEPGDHLHQSAEDDVATVAVRPQPARRGDQRQVRQPGDVSFDAVVAPTAGEVFVEAVAVDARDVGEDLTARQGLRHRRVGERQLRQVRAQREVDVDQPLVHQLHHRRGGVALADRTGLEQRPAHDRQTGADIGRARGGDRDRAVGIDQPDHRAGDAAAPRTAVRAPHPSLPATPRPSPVRSHVPSQGPARESSSADLNSGRYSNSVRYPIMTGAAGEHKRFSRKEKQQLTRARRSSRPRSPSSPNTASRGAHWSRSPGTPGSPRGRSTPTSPASPNCGGRWWSS